MTHADTAKSPTRRRLSIFITILATVVSGAVVAVVPGTAAHADPVLTIVYCEQHDLPNGHPFVQCWDLGVIGPLIPIPIPCQTCPEAVQFRWPIEVPDLDVSLVSGGMLDGLRNLLAAAAAKDPKERDAYRVEARKKYSMAASHLGQADLKVGDIWRNYNVKDASGDTEPQPNMF